MPLFGWQLVQLGHCVHVKLLTWPLHGFFHMHLLGTKHTFTWIFTCICFMHLLGLSHTFLTCVLGIAYAFASRAVHVCLACCPCVLRVSLVCALHVTSVADLGFVKEGFQVWAKPTSPRKRPKLGGSGGMPPQKLFANTDASRCILVHSGLYDSDIFYTLMLTAIPRLSVIKRHANAATPTMITS